MLRIQHSMRAACCTMPQRVCEVSSVERDDFVGTGGEAASLRGSLLYHLHVFVVMVVIGVVALTRLGLLVLELGCSVSLRLDKM